MAELLGPLNELSTLAGPFVLKSWFSPQLIVSKSPRKPATTPFLKGEFLHMIKEEWFLKTIGGKFFLYSQVEPLAQNRLLFGLLRMT